MIAICLFSGVQLLVLGIVGEYLGRLVQESKRRPLYLIDILLMQGQRHKLSAPLRESSLNEELVMPGDTSN
jgi:dolichol-phosphate mannosyltransferase